MTAPEGAVVDSWGDWARVGTDTVDQTVVLQTSDGVETIVLVLTPDAADQLSTKLRTAASEARDGETS